MPGSVDLLSFGVIANNLQEISAKPYDRKLICSIRGQQGGVGRRRRRRGIRGGPTLALRHRLCVKFAVTLGPFICVVRAGTRHCEVLAGASKFETAAKGPDPSLN
jgi:hypothetical protein